MNSATLQTARVNPPQVAGKTLSDDQQEALKQLETWLNSRDRAWACSLQGYAGTGKTTLVQALAAGWGADKSIAFTAPTNKATKVLMKMAEKEGLLVDCLTIHKMLSLGLADDDKEKYLVKTAKGEGRIYNYDLVVIDEASMIGDKLFAMIEGAAGGRRTAVLFVGDPLQLPPVKDGQPQAFQIEGPSLTKIVRQAEGNPIIAATAWVRARIEECDKVFNADPGSPPQSKDHEDGVHVIPAHQFLARTVEGLVKAHREEREAKGIAWRNVTVHEINRAVRAALYGRDAPAWVVGEKVIAASPIAAEHLYTDCEATILEVEEEQHPDFPQYRCHLLQLETEEGEEDVVPMVHPASATQLQRDLNRLAEEAKQAKAAGKGGWKWREFWRLKDSFGDLRHSHAITAHRSQGSTYDEVFVDAADIMSNRDDVEALKCLYVAISRASRNVWMRDF